jgi:hypothetical protein
MENKVYYVSKKDMKEIKESFNKDNSIYVAEIEGSTIQSLQDYLIVINEIFKFPIPPHGFDGYLDWIRDLDWLMKDKYVLINNNLREFLYKDLYLKNEIIEGFEKIILPWWQEEVEKCVVDGSVKPFNLYLVD